MASRQEPAEARRGVHLRVSGRVQGVGFRWFARESAEELGVAGYVRNLPTGEVEIWAEGAAEAVTAFVEEIRRGPRHARVTELGSREAEPTGSYTRFDIRD